MRFSLLNILVLALATDAVVASTWFSKASASAYNKWHETELERWLSDHDIPYPTPADRKDLENLVKSNWQSKIQAPIGDTADAVSDSYNSVKDWIFDSWTDSQLKDFLDKNGFPSPQPRKRDTLLTQARENYESIAKKVGQTSAYPGDWLYQTWSESDLKEFLDSRGFPAPQPTTRDKLIASVRRNSRLASLNMKGAVSAVSSSAASAASAASSSAGAAQQSLSDALFDAWSDSQLKSWCDENGVKVPQGSKRNEIIALARKHRKSMYDSGSSISSSAASAYGAATSKAGNQYAKATDDAQLKGEDAFSSVANTWSDSRLKAFLDARGVPVPQSGKRDELLASVILNKHKAASGFSAWTFDTWTTDNLKKWLQTQDKKAAKKAGSNRDELVKQAQAAYSSASKSGGSKYASVTSYLSSATQAAKDTTFDTWSDSELKSYLDSYGIPNYQGSTTNELRATAKKHSNYFRYGTSSPPETIFARVQNGVSWFLEQLGLGASKAQDDAYYHGEKAADYVKEKAQQGKDKVKEEL